MTSHWQKIYLFQKSCSNPTDISLQNYTFRNLSSCVTTPCKFRIWMCKQSICKSQPIIPWYNEYHILECPWDTWVHSKFQSSNISCNEYHILQVLWDTWAPWAAFLACIRFSLQVDTVRLLLYKQSLILSTDKKKWVYQSTLYLLCRSVSNPSGQSQIQFNILGCSIWIEIFHSKTVLAVSWHILADATNCVLIFALQPEFSS